MFDLKIGEHFLRLNFTGNALVPKIFPAFEHVLHQNSSDLFLNIYLIDNKSTQFELPKTPWHITDNLKNGEMWICDSKDLKIIHQPTKNTLLMLNLLTHEAIYWVNDSDQIPYFESSAPLRPILHWWMSCMGSQLLHAAAVGLPDKGVLLVGRGGSGKSNTALSCLNSKLFYAADDYCLLSFNPEPVAHTLFSTGKLPFEDVKKFPYLKSARHKSSKGEIQDEKALFFLYPKFYDRIIKSFPVKAVLITKVTNNESARLIPASTANAYLALAPSTIFQLHGENHTSHKNISSLLKTIPCFTLELCSDEKKNTEVIYNYLNEINTL